MGKRLSWLIFSAIIFTGVLSLQAIPVQATANQPVDIYVFYSNTCPHCHALLDYLDTNITNNSAARVNLFEVSNQENQELFANAGEILSEQVGWVPFMVIGGESYVGFDSAETTGLWIQQRIDYCAQNECADPLLPINPDPVIQAPIEQDQAPLSVPVETPDPVDTQPQENEDVTSVITVPILGAIDLKSASLPVVTILIAFLDGFNPCAMWVLLFLISLLLGMKNRVKMWGLGLAFIFTSGLVYFVFLAAWLQVYQVLGFRSWLTIAIGIIAIISGFLNLRKFWRERDGCEVVEKGQRKKMFDRIKKITENKLFFIALIGIILLAISVNVVELACSAGLPAIYTGLLAVSNVTGASYYLYLMLYVVVFVLDDLLIFTIAMVTLRATAISKKYSRWTSLVGGIIILVLGILLIVKPEVVMLAG